VEIAFLHVRRVRMSSGPERTSDSTSPSSVSAGRYPAHTSADRDELHRLVDELPEQDIPAVLAKARRRAHLGLAAEWPPAYFSSFASGRTDVGANHDDLLADGFGR